MSGRPRQTRVPRDPYDLGPVGTLIGPILAGGALLLVAAITWSLLQGQLPFRGGGPNGGPNPIRTPAPSNVVVVPEVTFPGSLVYAKAGNIWIQDDEDVRQLTDSGQDAMPAFSADGEWVYFVREQRNQRGLFPVNGRRSWYDLAIPELLRIPADGGEIEGLINGRYTAGNGSWYFFIRQPTPAPTGTNLAVISDGPNPTESNVVLQTFDTETKAFTRLDVAEAAPMGHQDPAWRPDGLILAYVMNNREGTKGAPRIMRYDVRSGRSAPITGPGYLAPAYSPDGRWLAATRTDGFGTDVVILDAADGSELLRLTSDGDSFSPVWSPAGDAVAFLRIDGIVVDLIMVPLSGPAGRWTAEEEIALTEVSGLDAGSRPGWFVPPEELPDPTPAPSSAAPSGSAGSSPAASAAP